MELDLAGAVEATPGRSEPQTLEARLAEARALARYSWAAGFAAGRRVLEASGGLGDGAAALHAAGAHSVVALVPSAILAEAASARAGEGVVLRVAEAGSVPAPDDAFDLVTCFGSLEDVSRPDAVLDELRRVLAPGGLLAVSLRKDCERLLHEHFDNVRTARVGGVLGAAVHDGELAGAVRAHSRLGEALATDASLLALASDRPLPAPAPAVVIALPADLGEWTERAAAQARELDELACELERARAGASAQAALADRLIDAEARLAGLLNMEERLRTVAAERDRAVAEGEAQRGRVRALERTLEQVRRSRSWRLTHPLRALRARARERP